MDALFGERPISWKALGDFSQIDANGKKHLKNVYACLTISTFVAAAGAGLHVLTIFKAGGILAALGSLGFMLGLAFTQNERKNQMTRLGMLSGFAFCTGLSLGPLLDHMIDINPAIIATAFFGTCLIFVCFTLASLWAPSRSWLYLGGTLFSAMSVLAMLSLMNIFFRSQMIFEINLYAGLFLFCGFILYDTQLIIEKRKNGDDDFIWHSVDLFLDFINIFRRLLIILGRKEESKKKRKN